MKIVKYIGLFLVCSFPLLGFSQQVDIQLPYFCGFEDPAENANWVLSNGANVNRWTIGSAISREGQNSLYISPDGGATASYDNYTGFVTAYRDIRLDAGQRYRISFDWLNPSDSGSLYVCFIPASEFSNPTNQWNGFGESAGMGLPTHLRLSLKPWVKGDTLMQHASSYQWINGAFEVMGDGQVNRLLFFWQSNYGSNGRTGACIDNIQIGPVDRYCGTVSDLRYKLISGGVGAFVWDGGVYNDGYELMYKNQEDDQWITHGDLKQQSDTIMGLPIGLYDVKVRLVCNGDTSIWYVFNNVFVYQEGEPCVDFLDYRSPESAVVTTGDYQNPYRDTLVVDYGYGSRYSRITTHFNQNEYDELTRTASGEALKTVPEGRLASVRLGNWETGSEAESVTYSMIVDENAPLLLLRYAMVLQNPENHTSSVMPQFVLEVFREELNPTTGKTELVLVDATCGDEKFVSGTNTSGWNKSKEEIGGSETLWRDWTSFGLDLRPYIGEQLYIRLTTYDCNQSGHFGYAYFTLECVTPRIEGMTCGVEKVDSLVAPEGFSYEWTLEGAPDSILSVERVYKPELDDATYNCLLTYKGGACQFNLQARVAPYQVECLFEPEIVYKDCRAEVYLKNESFAYTQKGEIADCDNYYWDLGNGKTSVQKDEKLVIDEPGIYTVTLTADILGECYDTYTKSFEILECKEHLYIDTINMCAGDTLVYNGLMFFTTKVYIDSLKTTTTNCDSVIVLDIRVNDEIVTDTIDYILRQYQEPYYDFNGKHLTETGLYVDTLMASFGCDSIVPLNLLVYPPLRAELEQDTIEVCADESSFVIGHTVLEGDYDVFRLDFDSVAQAAGFVDGTGSRPWDDVLEFPVPEGVKPNVYTAELTFESLDYGTLVFPVHIMVSYPASILVQKWDDVIALLNSQYNGGFEFTSYQWYKNEQPIPGENKPYLYLPERLDVEAEYRVKVTRADDGVSAFSCPIIPEWRESIDVYPTLVQAGMDVVVELSGTGQATLLDIMGLQIAKYPLGDRVNNIRMPDKTGSYILKVMIDEGETKTYNIIVK